MKKTIYRILPFCLAVVAPAVLQAQDINSTVEVRRAYEGKLHEVDKPKMVMDVPDSVTNFNLEFEYDNFRSRYVSSYEFHPHLLDLKPNAQVDMGNRFYMKLGAGYTLNPYFDLIWSPRLKRAWKINLYANHHSYVGNYYNLAPVAGSGDGSGFTIGKVREEGKVSRRFGYDLVTTAGLDTRYDWNKTVLMMDFSYYGLVQKDAFKSRGYNSADASFRLYSKSVKPNRCHFDIGLDYRFGRDDIAFVSGNGFPYLNGHDFNAYVIVGPVMRDKHKLLFDFEFEGGVYDGASDVFMGNMVIAPRYVFEKGRWDIRAGVKLTKLIGQAGLPEAYKAREQVIYPDVSINFTAVKNGLDIYLSATGGTSLNKYFSIVDKRHFADYTFGRGVYDHLLNGNVDNLVTTLGFKGRITPNFSYDIKGGYAMHNNGMFDAVVMTEAGLMPALGYAKYHSGYSSVDLRYDCGVVSASVLARYNYTDIRARRAEDVSLRHGLFAPSPVQVYSEITYNWRKRLYFGVDLEYASSRKAELESVYRIPRYFDLGLYAEYKHTSRFSMWLKGGNLLCDTIQRTPFYARKGLDITFGICLNM